MRTRLVSIATSICQKKKGKRTANSWKKAYTWTIAPRNNKLPLAHSRILIACRAWEPPHLVADRARTDDGDGAAGAKLLHE